MAESRPEWDACKKIDIEVAEQLGMNPEDNHIWVARLPFPKALIEDMNIDLDALSRKLSELLTSHADRLMQECRRDGH